MQTTLRDVQFGIDTMNDMLGLPREPYDIDRKPIVGVYHLERQLGKVRVVIMRDKGCTSNITPLCTKKECATAIHYLTYGAQAMATMITKREGC